MCVIRKRIKRFNWVFYKFIGITQHHIYPHILPHKWGLARVTSKLVSSYFPINI